MCAISRAKARASASSSGNTSARSANGLSAVVQTCAQKSESAAANVVALLSAAGVSVRPVTSIHSSTRALGGAHARTAHRAPLARTASGSSRRRAPRAVCTRARITRDAGRRTASSATTHVIKDIDRSPPAAPTSDHSRTMEVRWLVVILSVVRAVVPPPPKTAGAAASIAVATHAPLSLIVTPESFVEGDINTYAVYNGSHTRAYDPTTPRAVVHARSEVVAFLMQVAAGPPLVHGRITVSSSDARACAVQIEGPALKARKIAKQARRMFVKLDCLGTTMTWATITVTIDVRVNGAYVPVSFGFKKKCAGDAPVPGFDVTLGAVGDVDGGRSSSMRIVHNGETQGAYLPDDPSARITYDTTDVHTYIAMANSSAVTSHAFGAPVVERSHPWCRVLLSGPASRGGVASATLLLLVFKFDCSSSGTAKVTVTLPLAGTPDGVKFAFLKECRAGEIPGFDVTLSSYEPGVRASYAVKNGEATSAYHEPRGAELPLAVVREAQSKTSFYLQMSTFSSVEFEPPIVRSSDAFCLVSAAGDAASGGWVDDISSQLIVNFNCIDSGTAVVTVTVPLQMAERLVNASFAFRKECRWTSTPGFDVTLGAWIKSEGGTYAVRNGAATPAFSLWDPKAVVRARQYSSIFYLQMSTHDEQDFEWPTVESSDPMVKVTLGGPASKGGTARAGADKPLALVARYDCMKTGSAVVTVTIPLGPWNEAAFSFQKARARARACVPSPP